MKLQPESKKELTRIACGTAICTAVMWVILKSPSSGMLVWMVYRIFAPFSSIC